FSVGSMGMPVVWWPPGGGALLGEPFTRRVLPTPAYRTGHGPQSNPVRFSAVHADRPDVYVATSFGFTSRYLWGRGSRSEQSASLVCPSWRSTTTTGQYVWYH